MDWQGNSVELLQQLTPKERAVLDLVLEHMPTKEIARELGLAPNTVDMRLRSAREKLGTADRKATARAYTRLLSACGKTTCGPEVIDSSPLRLLPEAQVQQEAGTFVLEDAGWIDRSAPWDLKVDPAPDLGAWTGQMATPGFESWSDRLGAWARIALVFGTAALMAVIVLSIFAIADSLSRLELPGYLTT